MVQTQNMKLEFSPVPSIRKFTPAEITSEDYTELKYTLKYIVYNYVSKDQFNATFLGMVKVFGKSERRVQQILNIKKSSSEIIPDKVLTELADYFKIKKAKLFTKT